MLFDQSRALLAGVPPHRDLGQAVGRRDQRAGARRRLRADAVLPLSRRRRQSEDPARPARDQGRPVPRRRRHPARAAHRAAAGCDDSCCSRARRSTSTKAKALNLIHAIVPAADLIKAAKDWIKGGGKAVAPWDEKGFKLPGGPVFSKAGMMMFPAGNAIYRRETYDNYPAARAIMSCVYEGLQLPIDAALRVESRYFTQILRSKEAAAMIRSLFLSMQELNKGARRPQGVPPTKVKKLAVIGAGFMGASVGYVSARAGIDVVLIDRDQASADKGKAHAQGVIDDLVKKGRAKQGEGDAIMSRITATADYNAHQGLRPRHRGRVRGPQGQGRDLCQGAAAAEERRDLRLQHLDPADQLAGRGVQGPGQVHRHPLLLAGREDDAGRDHPRQEHRRRRARDRARLRAPDRQDADRRERLPRLLRQPLRAALHRRRPARC